MNLIGWLSLCCLVVLFLERWSVHLGYFCVCWCACYIKAWSLRCSPGQGNTGCCAVTLYVGEGLRGSNGACSTLCRMLVTPSTTHNQIGPLWCWFPSGWACAHSRPLWVSPTTSPVRLGVSPTAAFTPTGVFNQRFEALFPCAGAVGCAVCFAPPLFLPVYLCANVGPQGLSATTLWGPPAAAFLWVLSAPLPVSAPPTGLDECSLFISLVVGLPYILIFCQFWLFFVFKLSLSFFWLYEEAQCVYLHLHLGRKFEKRSFQSEAIEWVSRINQYHFNKGSVFLHFTYV